MKSLNSVIFKNSIRRDERIGKTAKEKFFGGVSFVIVFVFLSIVMTLTSIYVTVKLDEIDQTYAFVNILLLMNFFILFTKSIFESLNVLYFSKDLKVLLRMPLKPISILHSKLQNMIISEYPMEIVMLAIPMIVYGIFTKVGIGFYFYMIGILLILPIIPIMITSLVIGIIMRFTNSIKNKSKSMYITIFLTIIIITIITGVFNANSRMSVSKFESVILAANGLAESIANYFVLIKPIMNTLLNYNNINGVVNFSLYVLESFLTYFILLFMMSKIYLKGAKGTTINSIHDKRRTKELKLSDFKKKNQAKSYFSKELKTLLRTPIFCLQCFILPIIYPVVVFALMAMFINFANQVGIDALKEFYERIVTTWGIAVFLSISQVFYMMNFASIIAVSREAQNSIFIKYIPMKFEKQFHLKLRIGIFTNLIAGILVTLAYYAVIKNVFYSIYVFAIVFFINIIGEKFKILIDLKNPQVSWDSEYTMMKQNTNVMYELFYTLAVIGILIGISFLIKNSLVFLSLILGLSIIINMSINEYIHNNKTKLIKRVI